MSKLTKVEELKTKRFVIRKSLIGKNVVITFTNKKQENVSYNHDEVYNTHSEKFEAMNCFQKYKSYTNTNAVPAFCRNLQTIKQYISCKSPVSSTCFLVIKYEQVSCSNGFREFDSHTTTKNINKL